MKMGVGDGALEVQGVQGKCWVVLSSVKPHVHLAPSRARVPVNGRVWA